MYHTTHCGRALSLTFDISDHRDRCNRTVKEPGGRVKRQCPVQGTVHVSIADMGGQVSG